VKGKHYREGGVSFAKRCKIATYISDMLKELSVLAPNKNMPLLNQSLRMAELESDFIAFGKDVARGRVEESCH
jgi:hypothetical protein